MRHREVGKNPHSRVPSANISRIADPARRSAPALFAAWMAAHRHIDPKFGHVYLYHPRSDAHSVRLCELVLADLEEACPLLRKHGAAGLVAYGINVRYKWPGTGKVKTLDLAIGRPATRSTGPPVGLARTTEFAQVLLSCEAKTVMTEHKKSQPRVFDELASSHEIVHQGEPGAIAAGITVVNIAPTFVSPLRNQSYDTPLKVTTHRQPQVTASMIAHLRGLPIRAKVGEVGFDAYCTIVVDCDNQTYCRLYTDPPCPQPGDPDHYDTFLRRLAASYMERFASLR